MKTQQLSHPLISHISHATCQSVDHPLRQLMLAAYILRLFFIPLLPTGIPQEIDAKAGLDMQMSLRGETYVRGHRRIAEGESHQIQA